MWTKGPPANVGSYWVKLNGEVFYAEVKMGPAGKPLLRRLGTSATPPVDDASLVGMDHQPLTPPAP